MATLVPADEKGRIPIRGSEPGRKYLVSRTGKEWRVIPFSANGYRSRNSREFSPRKGRKSLFAILKEMGDEGLRLDSSENARQPVPPCPF